MYFYPALTIFKPLAFNKPEFKLKKMNFQCKELIIEDDEFGCTITFSDTNISEDQFKTADEIMNSDEKYLLIQRTYPEDDDDLENYHIETSENDIELLSDEIKMTVVVDRETFIIYYPGAHLEIKLNLNEKELKNLKRVLENRFKDRLTLEKQE